MILLGVGSNLSSSYGDRFKNIDMAISALDGYGILIKKLSSYYESLAFPNNNDPKFINVVAEVDTKLPPVDLASVMIFIENTLERVRVKKNDPRTCDIDLIDYENKIFDFKYNNLNFTVPHKELIHRNFVLIPLQEIIPDWKHPITNEHINILIDRLSEDDKKSILKINKS